MWETKQIKVNLRSTQVNYSSPWVTYKSNSNSCAQSALQQPKNLTPRRRYGFKLYLSSKVPMTTKIMAPIKIPIRCLSIGRNMREVIKSAIKIGIPPPRGTG